jgi:hypothetical protein
MNRIGAIVAQLLSYATTLSAAIFVIRPGDEVAWALTILVSLGFEVLFMAMKEKLFSKPGHPAGWIGLILDGAVNTGGILPWAGRLLTFGPILLMLGVFRVDVSDPATTMTGGVIVSAIFGFVLSIVPHWLWRK